MRNFFVEAEQWRAQSERHTVAIGKLKETNALWAGCLPELVRVLSGSQEVEQQAAVAGITPEWLRSAHGALGQFGVVFSPARQTLAVLENLDQHYHQAMQCQVTGEDTELGKARAVLTAGASKAYRYCASCFVISMAFQPLPGEPDAYEQMLSSLKTEIPQALTWLSTLSVLSGTPEAGALSHMSSLATRMLSGRLCHFDGTKHSWTDPAQIAKVHKLHTDTVLAMREFLPSGSAEVLAASSLDLVAAVPATFLGAPTLSPSQVTSLRASLQAELAERTAAIAPQKHKAYFELWNDAQGRACVNGDGKFTFLPIALSDMFKQECEDKDADMDSDEAQVGFLHTLLHHPNQASRDALLVFATTSASQHQVGPSAESFAAHDPAQRLTAVSAAWRILHLQSEVLAAYHAWSTEEEMKNGCPSATILKHVASIRLACSSTLALADSVTAVLPTLALSLEEHEETFGESAESEYVTSKMFLALLGDWRSVCAFAQLAQDELVKACSDKMLKFVEAAVDDLKSTYPTDFQEWALKVSDPDMERLKKSVQKNPAHSSIKTKIEQLQRCLSETASAKHLDPLLSNMTEQAKQAIDAANFYLVIAGVLALVVLRKTRIDAIIEETPRARELQDLAIQASATINVIKSMGGGEVWKQMGATCADLRSALTELAATARDIAPRSSWCAVLERTALF